jgi:hypothetical protein
MLHPVAFVNLACNNQFNSIPAFDYGLERFDTRRQQDRQHCHTGQKITPTHNFQA